ncbi:MAG: immunoglobulin domain-containing protein, partial [Methanotrichaceae archaeon]|nr:immunoglobulin domain-containing protein [Methanotrichaceae archaeon]
LGEQATFSVTATGSEPLSYQWKKDDQDISGANTATYTIDSVTSSDSGEYNVIVSNDCGSVGSDIAKLVTYVCVKLDIKPGSCPNPINTKAKGVFPVAILGTNTFDVTTIDPETVKLTRDGYNGVKSIRHNYEDVATPFEGNLCDCVDLDGDGYTDITFKFDTPTLVAGLGLDSLDVGETTEINIEGNLFQEIGGTQIKGQDCIQVKTKGIAQSGSIDKENLENNQSLNHDQNPAKLTLNEGIGSLTVCQSCTIKDAKEVTQLNSIKKEILDINQPSFSSQNLDKKERPIRPDRPLRPS